MDLTDVRFRMTSMSHRGYDPWEIEVSVIIVECLSIEIVQDCFTREDLWDYYHFLQEHFRSDYRLEERISETLERLTDHGLLEKVNDNEYKLVKGELLDDILELKNRISCAETLNQRTNKGDC